MSSPTTTGLALPLDLALPVRGFVEVAQRAEAAGYDRLWAAEASNNDALEADVRRRFEAFRAAGVDEPVAFLVSGQNDPDAARAELEATTAALAPRA